MKRRTLMIGLGATAAGGSALVGSGAFTSVQADRDVEIDVADDSDAFLQLQPAEDDDGDELPNGQYARERNGILELDFTGDNEEIAGGGEGFNARANTGVSRVFEVRNQGTQGVEVALRTSEQDDTDTNGVVLVPSDVDAPGEQNLLLTITAHGVGLDPVALDPGEKQQFSVTATVREGVTDDPADVIDTDEITIQAEATE